MTIESATYLNDLNSSYPAGTDQKQEGNDHIALIKAVSKATFPGMAGRAWRLQNKSGTYTLVGTDNMSWINFTSTATLNLTAAATIGNGFMAVIRAISGVTVTIDPNSSELINSAATFTLKPNCAGLLLCTGGTWSFLLIQGQSETELTTPTLTRPTLSSPRETISSGSASGAQSLDLANQTYFAYTMTGNVTFSFANVPSTGLAICATVELTQGGSGSYTATWPGAVKWPSGVAPTLTTTVGKTDIITLLTRDGGTTWYGFVAGQNY